MKQASILLSLTKDNQVIVHNVTPIEAMLLVAEHHRAVGGNPVEVLKNTIKDTGQEKVTYVADGPKKGEVEKREWITEKPERNEDQEIARISAKYHLSKIEHIQLKVRNFPKDFDEALQKGIAIVMPTKPIAVAQTEVK